MVDIATPEQIEAQMNDVDAHEDLVESLVPAVFQIGVCISFTDDGQIRFHIENLTVTLSGVEKIRSMAAMSPSGDIDNPDPCATIRSSDRAPSASIWLTWSEEDLNGKSPPGAILVIASDSGIHGTVFVGTLESWVSLLTRIADRIDSGDIYEPFSKEERGFSVSPDLGYLRPWWRPQNMRRSSV